MVTTRSRTRAVESRLCAVASILGDVCDSPSRNARSSRARFAADGELVGTSVLAIVPLARSKNRSTSAVRGSRLGAAAPAFSSSLMNHLPRERSMTLRMTRTAVLASGGSSRSAMFKAARPGDRLASSKLCASQSAVRASW